MPRMVSGDEAIGQVESLVSELRAISLWDAQFWRDHCLEWSETVAFVSRQRRRDEIIRDLTRIFTGLDSSLSGPHKQVVHTLDRTRDHQQHREELP
jgi:hypothetical protein